MPRLRVFSDKVPPWTFSNESAVQGGIVKRHAGFVNQVKGGFDEANPYIRNCIDNKRGKL
jgi:hypothetical protein